MGRSERVCVGQGGSAGLSRRPRCRMGSCRERQPLRSQHSAVPVRKLPRGNFRSLRQPRCAAGECGANARSPQATATRPHDHSREAAPLPQWRSMSHAALGSAFAQLRRCIVALLRVATPPGRRSAAQRWVVQCCHSTAAPVDTSSFSPRAGNNTHQCTCSARACPRSRSRTHAVRARVFVCDMRERECDERESDAQ